jgi:7-cyano-7-deazaguanine reductase
MADESFRYLQPHKDEFRGLDTFPAPPSVTTVQMASDEVSALCAVTGQPDWYTVTITYRPDSRCVESKSLKLYLGTFRNQGVFGESFADRIAHDIMEAAAPRWVRVTVVQKPRGGIAITANARLTKEHPA